MNRRPPVKTENTRVTAGYAEKTPAEAARRRRWYIHPSQCPDNGAHPSASKAPQRTRQTTAFRRRSVKAIGERIKRKAAQNSRRSGQRHFPKRQRDLKRFFRQARRVSCPRMTRVSLVHRQTPQTPSKSRTLRRLSFVKRWIAPLSSLCTSALALPAWGSGFFAGR